MYPSCLCIFSFRSNTPSYGNESRRLYHVLDDHLAKSTSGFLVGDRLTIADISCWPWIASHRMFPLSLSSLHLFDVH